MYSRHCNDYRVFERKFVQASVDVGHYHSGQ